MDPQPFRGFILHLGATQGKGKLSPIGQQSIPGHPYHDDEIIGSGHGKAWWVKASMGTLKVNYFSQLGISSESGKEEVV